jgi:outer membrane protein insertion porin family
LRFNFIKNIIIFGIVFHFCFSQQKLINEITFSGNDFLTEPELIKWLPINETSLFNKSIYNSRSLKLAVIQLKHYYSSQGFINAIIEPEVTNVENNISINFNIFEGNQYHIKKIEFFGNNLYSNEEIMKLLDVEINDVFNPLKITKKLKKLIRNYLSEGKFKISIYDELIEEENKVIIRVNIAEKETFYYGNITIDGLEKLKPKTILRELLINSGLTYNILEIEETQTRIFSSLLFSSVEIFPKIRGETQDTVDLIIKVKEMNDKDIRGEIGFGQTESPLGENSPPLSSFELSSTIQSGYFFNTSNKFTFKIDLGLTIDENLSLFNNKLFPQRNFSISYRTPWVFGLRVPLNLKLFDYYVEEEDDFRHRRGIESSFLYRQNEKNKLLGSLILESVNFTDQSIESDDKLERKIRITYQRHSLTNLISPENGYYFGYYSTLRGTFLGGKTHYLLTDFEYKKFRNFLDLFIVGFRFKTGYLKLLKNTEENSISDFFNLGGSTSLRGWDKAEELNYSGNAIFRILNNIEFRFPIYNKLGGELFFDSGILGRNKSELNYSNIYWDIGFGFTISTPLGPARIDIAYPYAKKEYNTSLSLLYSF